MASGAAATVPVPVDDEWDEVVDASSSQSYFVHRRTLEAVWFRPGWTRMKDAGSGTIFFYQAESGTTAMNLPDGITRYYDEVGDAKAGIKPGTAVQLMPKLLSSAASVASVGSVASVAAAVPMSPPTPAPAPAPAPAPSTNGNITSSSSSAAAQQVQKAMPVSQPVSPVPTGTVTPAPAATTPAASSSYQKSQAQQVYSQQSQPQAHHTRSASDGVARHNLDDVGDMKQLLMDLLHRQSALESQIQFLTHENQILKQRLSDESFAHMVSRLETNMATSFQALEARIAAIEHPGSQPQTHRRPTLNNATAAPIAAAAASASSDARKKNPWQTVRHVITATRPIAADPASMRKARMAVFAEPTSGDASAAAHTPAAGTDQAKSSAAKNAIAAAMRHYLFESLSSAQRATLVDHMFAKRYDRGATVIAQGAAVHFVFVVEQGLLQLSTHDSVIKNVRPGQLIGETALLYQASAEYTVKALEESKLWLLPVAEYRRLVSQSNSADLRDLVQWLHTVPLFSSLSSSQLSSLAEATIPESYTNGQHIIRIGEVGEAFYIIKAGSVSCRVYGAAGESVEVAKLGVGSYFGEMALMKKIVRTADVVAVGDVHVLKITKQWFDTLLGSLESHMNTEAERRTQEIHAALKQSAPRTIDSEAPLATPHVPLEEVEIIDKIGSGSFGRVYMVRWGDTVAALKRVWKSQLVTAQQHVHAQRERKVLAQLEHPFIVRLYGTSQDASSVYIFLEPVPGGELWSLLYTNRAPELLSAYGGFVESAVVFYTAIVVDALAYLHSRSIAYRDLKLENLLIDEAGYAKLVDFGFAKSIPFFVDGVEHDRSFTLLGSPDYLSPEIILYKGHTTSADLWTLGVLLYEMLAGCTPFYDMNTNIVFEKAVKASYSFPAGMEAEHPHACDLVRQLLQTNPAKRLGALAGGMDELKAHPFFRNISWEHLRAKRLASPFVPTVRGAEDTSNFEPEWEKENPDEDDPFEGDTTLFAGF